MRGQRVQTVTVAVYDPGNSNPLFRKEVRVISLDALHGRAYVDLLVTADKGCRRPTERHFGADMDQAAGAVKAACARLQI